MTDAAESRWPSRLGTVLGPRGGLVLLVAAHFVAAILQSWTLPPDWLGQSSFWWIRDLITSSLDAIPLAQLALIAAFVTLGSGRLLVRIARSGLLLLWMELAHLIGTRCLAGGRDSLGFEESLGTNLWNLAFLALPLLLYRLFARRHLTSAKALVEPRFQFRILHLLLITTEAAALLATIRAFVIHQDDWRDQLWRAIRDHLFQFASYDYIALVLLAATPAVLVAIRWQSVRRAALVLVGWEFVLSVGFVVYRYLLPDLDPQFPIVNPEPAWLWGFYWLMIAVACGTVAAVIWLTLAVVRWLGYDFLPVRGGRHSSEATSAA